MQESGNMKGEGTTEAGGSLDEMTRDLQWCPGSEVNLSPNLQPLF